MKTNRLLYIFILLVITALAIVLLAATMADSAGAQEAEPECFMGCPKPPMIYRIFMPFTSQCKGPFCGQEHSGPPDGEPVR